MDFCSSPAGVCLCAPSCRNCPAGFGIDGRDAAVYPVRDPQYSEDCIFWILQGGQPGAAVTGYKPDGCSKAGGADSE